MEDYEYFWILQHETERLEKMSSHPLLVSEARSLLAVPSAISTDLTHFTTDPRPMMEHRDRIARLIERLEKIR